MVDINGHGVGSEDGSGGESVTSRAVDLVDLTRSFGSIRLAVIGDAMLDVWMEGSARRISPEAPVPVIRLQNTDSFPGGAANVAGLAAALGISATLVGVVGDDDVATELEHVVGLEQVETRLFRDKSRITTRKTRIVSGPQQVCRVDEEINEPLSAESEAALRVIIQEVVSEVDVVVLQDYGKGTVTDQVVADVLLQASKSDVPVVADPSGDGAGRFSRVALVKPNRMEAFASLGRPFEESTSASALALELSRELMGCPTLVTDGKRGCGLAVSDESFAFPAPIRNVIDATGAGDAVVAVVGATLGAGGGFWSAAALGNLAGSIAVTKRGTCTFGLDELVLAVQAQDG